MRNDLIQHAVALLIVAIVAISPALPILFLSLVADTSGLNAGNSALAVLPMLLMLTVPAGAAVTVMVLISAACQVLWHLFRTREEHTDQ